MVDFNVYIFHNTLGVQVERDFIWKNVISGCGLKNIVRGAPEGAFLTMGFVSKSANY